ncbi:uncharacterized protein LOC122371264 [Amphibalanus amphitrite]|uniref:uncharacterized protein LOC122371264 n=1 Tax=Amphibalanus amphitrite TaxID=1232801 RepID=UPI001C90AA9F|nr:uncharacterized protein LOC122371264 [Amphibalanus amphitrite]
MRSLEGAPADVSEQAHLSELCVEDGQSPRSVDLDGDFTYRLVGVVSHYGSATHSGHYVSDVYSVGRDRWFHYDDRRVSCVDEARSCFKSSGRRRNAVCSQQPCGLILHTFSGEPLKVRGEVQMDVVYRGESFSLPLVEVDGTGPLLFGRNWLESIRLDWRTICMVTTQTLGSGVESVLHKYSDVFADELGCAKGIVVDIPIDPDTRPIFYKPRPVPLAYRAAVDAELDRQIRAGLLEPVKHCTWAAPIVTALKASAGSEQEHLQRLEEVLRRLLEAGLRLQRKKCQFAASEVVYLGHHITADGIKPTADKDRPSCPFQLRRCT